MSESPHAPLSEWSGVLQQTLDELAGPLDRVHVFRATDSTQDAARRMNAVAGDVVIAARQTAGRGRLGRSWVDTGDEGIAMTAVVQRDAQPSGHLAIASAIAVARTAEAMLGRPVGIKWPNDILVDGRKLSGVLVEQVDAVALVGIGINILQKDWPDEVAATAVSLRQLGVHVDRLDVLKELLVQLNEALLLETDALAAAYSTRDALAGQTVQVLASGMPLGVTVVRVEPFRGLLVEIEGQQRWLDAATTSILKG
jgi:biotin-[acetyl-CoA-carboxylase] ligase BirA-like protein